MSKQLYRVIEPYGSKQIEVVDIPIEKERSKTYRVTPCQASDYGVVINKLDRRFSLTKAGAIKYAVEQEEYTLESAERAVSDARERLAHIKGMS